MILQLLQSKLKLHNLIKTNNFKDELVIRPTIIYLSRRFLQQIIKFSSIKLMGQSCKNPRAEINMALPSQKMGSNLCETASLQLKSQSQSPFTHLSQTVTLKMRELQYERHQLQTIMQYPIIQLPNGVAYQGPIQNDEMNGMCRLAIPDGSYYQGHISGNQLNGEGMLINSKGEYYIGSFKNNKAEGRGRYFGQDFTYEGEFKNNLYWGRGKLTKNEGIFQGLFEKGKMRKGKLTKLSNMSVYEGEFQGNIENGWGKLTIGNTSHEGIFKNGLLQGQAKVVDSSGDQMICNFEKGRMVNIIRLTASEYGLKEMTPSSKLRETN